MQGDCQLDLIPKDALRPSLGFNFAPMVDFLFIILTVFAGILLTRKALNDSSITLLQAEPRENHTASSPPADQEAIHLSISSNGEYQWMDSPSSQIVFSSIEQLQNELDKSVFDKEKTHVLLHIDKDAAWQSIGNLIVKMSQAGLTIYPVFKSKEKEPFILTNED